MKICSKCKIQKDISNFYKSKSSNDVPISKFDKNTPLSIINSLDNLQPLWVLDNLSKSNKI